MRFAGQFMSGFPAAGGMPAAEDYMKRIRGIDISKPAYYESKPGGVGLDPSKLDLTVPEMRPGPYMPGQDLMRDEYIRQNPGSGIAAVPGLLKFQMIKEAFEGQPAADGTLYKGQPDPFQERNMIRPSDSDNQLMDIMRSGFV